MRLILAFATVAILAACTQEPPVVVVVPPESYRDQSAQIASQTNVTAARMAGDWVIRQRFAAQTGQIGGMTLRELPAGALQLSVFGNDCANGVCSGTETLVLLEPTGPGRWTAVDPPAGVVTAEIWVMWMDFDTRTAAIGTPSGEFGWIMDKSPTGGHDRITAARDIMDWFGYDVERLQEGDL